MTRRQLRRRCRRRQLLVIAGGLLAFVVAVDLLDLVMHVLGVLIVAAVLGGAGYWLGQRKNDPEVARLRAQLEQARAELRNARASAAAAWDASASVPPRKQAPTDSRRLRLVRSPMSGVHSLNGDDQ